RLLRPRARGRLARASAGLDREPQNGSGEPDRSSKTTLLHDELHGWEPPIARRAPGWRAAFSPRNRGVRCADSCPLSARPPDARPRPTHTFNRSVAATGWHAA